MRLALMFAWLALATSPARAATNLVCDGIDAPVRLAVVLASGRTATPLAVSLSDERGERRSIAPGVRADEALVIGQSWLDRTEFRLDVLDVEGRAYEGRLRVGFPKDGPVLASGILILGEPGRIIEVKCESE